VNHPTTIAVDLSKSVFEVAVSVKPGRVAERGRLSRRQMTRFFSQRPPATVLLEACGSSHHWARHLESLGHRVLLLPPQHVRRYVLCDKTGRADATALLEAHRNEQIVPVPIKTLHQQALASLHRLRSGWLATRTARINAVRGLLRELGILIPRAYLILARSHSLAPSKGRRYECRRDPPKSARNQSRKTLFTRARSPDTPC
jgi:transposase